MKSRRVVVLVGSLLACGVASGSAQAPRFSVTPRAGAFQPVNDLGRVVEGENTVGVHLEGAALLGLSVGAQLPRLPFELRGHFLYVPSTQLIAERPGGQETCGPNCTRFLSVEDPIASSSVLVAAADAVVRAPIRFPLRPYLAVGGGIRRYGFDQDELEGPYAEAFENDAVRPVAHLGIGFDLRVRRLGLNVEVGDHLGRHRIAESSSGAIGSNDLQHDVSATIGVHIGLP